MIVMTGTDLFYCYNFISMALQIKNI